MFIGLDNKFIRIESAFALRAGHYIRKGNVSEHSVGGTIMINQPAELGWINKNLPLGLWAAPSGLDLGFYLPNFALLESFSKPGIVFFTTFCVATFVKCSLGLTQYTLKGRY